MARPSACRQTSMLRDAAGLVSCVYQQDRREMWEEKKVKANGVITESFTECQHQSQPRHYMVIVDQYTAILHCCWRHYYHYRCHHVVHFAENDDGFFGNGENGKRQVVLCRVWLSWLLTMRCEMWCVSDNIALSSCYGRHAHSFLMIQRFKKKYLKKAVES